MVKSLRNFGILSPRVFRDISYSDKPEEVDFLPQYRTAADAGAHGTMVYR